MSKVLVLSLLPALALAAPPPTGRRIAALVVPMDKGAESQQVKVEQYIREALSEFAGLEVRSTDELFGILADDDAEAALKRAETGFTESKASFEARTYDDAERKLRATIKEFGKAAPAMKACGKLCDAVAMYAAVLQARGDLEEAKIAVLDLLALAPTFELDRKKYPQEFLALRSTVALGRNAQLRGSLELKSKPSGARVYLDGEFKGFTPLKLDTLPIGKHVLKFDRPGFKRWGSLVEVTPEDVEVTQELTASNGYKAYDQVLDRLAGEALKGQGGGTMASVAKTLNLDKGMVAVLKEVNETGGNELTLALYDLKSGKRMGGKRATFQGDEFGQLKSEISRMVNAVMTQGESGPEKVSRTGDPLKGKSGMEEWNGEDRGGTRTSKEGKKKGDPLDSVNGMDEW